MISKNRTLWLLMCGFFILLIDQGLKLFAFANQSFKKYLIEPWLGWEYLGNHGIAFGLPIPNLLLIFITPFILLAIFILLGKMYEKDKQLPFALILILSGAISNYIDRVLFGITIDYIRVYNSVFNISDVSIVVGAIAFLLRDKKSYIVKKKTN